MIAVAAKATFHARLGFISDRSPTTSFLTIPAAPSPAQSSRLFGPTAQSLALGEARRATIALQNLLRKI
jgi:hypothetical protein